VSITEITPVKLWREWYVRVVEDSIEPGQRGHITHWGPWLTRTAAEYCARLVRDLMRHEGRL
jgi:hypothetical protein